MLQCHRLLLSNTLYFRDDHYRNILKTLRPSMNQMKMNTEFKDAMRALNSFVDEREQVLNTTLKWLMDGLNLSQSWIRLDVFYWLGMPQVWSNRSLAKAFSMPYVAERKRHDIW